MYIKLKAVIIILKLDERKIRKGKAIGLPYMGSKKKISKKIVEIIKQNFQNYNEVYDIFGGGGAISAELLLNGFDVHYNDLDDFIKCAFIKSINITHSEIKQLLLSREQFKQLRQYKEQILIKNKKISDEEKAIIQLKLLVNSFGNTCSSYLYSRKNSDKKYKLAVDYIKKFDKFTGYRGIQLQQLERLPQLERLQQLQQLQQLERLQQLQRLQQLERLPKHTTCLDYTSFSDLNNKLIYLDPPYENTTQYGQLKARKVSKIKYKQIKDKLINLPIGTTLEDDGFVFHLEVKGNGKRMYYKDVKNKSIFDSQKFYDWAVEMSKNNVVIISSYCISDPRFKVVYEFSNAHSNLQVGKANNGNYEKLFMVKDLKND